MTPSLDQIPREHLTDERRRNRNARATYEPQEHPQFDAATNTIYGSERPTPGMFASWWAYWAMLGGLAIGLVAFGVIVGIAYGSNIQTAAN